MGWVLSAESKIAGIVKDAWLPETAQPTDVGWVDSVTGEIYKSLRGVGVWVEDETSEVIDEVKQEAEVVEQKAETIVDEVEQKVESLGEQIETKAEEIVEKVEEVATEVEQKSASFFDKLKGAVTDLVSSEPTPEAPLIDESVTGQVIDETAPKTEATVSEETPKAETPAG